MRPRRLSSRVVQVGMVGTLSMTLAACGGKSTRADCVDGSNVLGGQYQIVQDGNCDSSNYGRYFWYYGGAHSGTRAYKGTTLKPKKGEIKTSSGRTIRKGGFGSSGSGGS